MSDASEVAEIIGQDLDGSLGIKLCENGYRFCTLDDLGEIYVRTASGEHFRLVCEPVSDDDIVGWGIEFDD